MLKERIITTFRALKYKNYRLFFEGQCISLVGTWIQNIAMSWLVYGLTNSAMAMGVIMFLNSLPSLVITPFAGVVIDRLNKHKLLLTVQILFAIQALIIAILTLCGVIQIWHIIVLGILINITAAFDMPLRQAFVINLVDNPKDLSNAISLNSSCFNLARLIGPAIAGVLIAGFGEGICFLINAISYIPVIISVALIKVCENKNKNNEESTSIIHDLKEGFEYAKNSKHISTLILFLAVICFVGMCYPLLMPIYAKEVLNGTARMLGILMSAAGIGALASLLFLASKRTSLGLPKQ